MRHPDDNFSVDFHEKQIKKTVLALHVLYMNVITDGNLRKLIY